MSYHMTLDPPSIKTDFRKHSCPTHVDFRKKGHKRRNQALETELYTPRGSTRLSVLASCKLSFSMCCWSSSEGEFHFEVLAQETSVSKPRKHRFQNSTENHVKFMQTICKLWLEKSQISHCKQGWHQAAVKGPDLKITGTDQRIHWFLKC